MNNAHFRKYKESDPSKEEQATLVKNDWGYLNGVLLDYVFDRLTEARDEIERLKLAENTGGKPAEVTKAEVIAYLTENLK